MAVKIAADVVRLEPSFVERPWGKTDLAPLYSDAVVGPKRDRKIGEVWFTPGPEFPLLVKFLFTSEKLSVQVHPGDDFAKLHEQSRGKTEMWHILAAEPGASIALGFKERVTRTELVQAIESGRVEELLNWVPVEPGDTYFAEAGVVHAIGAGVTLCEIQQNSDVTYRLFDYGRGRTLHLEKGLQVLDPNPYDGRRNFPVACQHFKTELLTGSDVAAHEGPTCDHLLIGLEGLATVGSEPLGPGEVWFVPAGSEPVRVTDAGNAKLLRVSCSG